MAPIATDTAQEFATYTSLSLTTRDEEAHHGAAPIAAACAAERAVADALRSRIEHIDPDSCEPGDEDTFFVADLGEVYRQHQRWQRNLPRVQPHYAVKCNADPVMIGLLAALGLGFDCASKAEIEQILGTGIVDPSRIIYAQPCKTKSFVRFAAEKGVKQMTFDNAEELYKTKRFFPEAELFLRILTDDSASLCQLSLKFGASLDAAQGLLELAKELDLNVVGVAFHVGSGASDPKAFTRAVRDARTVFDQAIALGFDMHTLDVGGGFCSDDSFERMASVLSAALQTYFPSRVRVIGEPGRYYASSAFTIACHIIGRRAVPVAKIAPGNASYMLYINDGVYGNFSSIMFDHQHPIPQVLKSGTDFLYKKHPTATANGTTTAKPVSSKKTIEYSVWGPSCDGIDCVTSSFKTAHELDIGDWLYFEQMGAYTKCSATQFNGFTNRHDTVYVNTEPDIVELLLRYGEVGAGKK